ncbi:CUB domain-containing protein 1 [Diretmus argenteus]
MEGEATLQQDPVSLLTSSVLSNGAAPIPQTVKFGQVTYLRATPTAGHAHPECLRTTVKPDKDSAVTVSTELPADQCAVCKVSGVNETQTSCHSSLSLVPEEEVTLLFNCSQPMEEAFSVEITRSIECTTDSCSPTTGDVQPAILKELPRTFTWDLKAPEKTVVALQILGKGLKETSEPSSCPDGFHYSVAVAKSNGKVQTRAYCPDGSVTHLDLPNQSAVSLRVKPEADVVPVVFQVSAKPLKGRTVVVSADPGTTVVISRGSEDPECDVCSADGSDPTCSPTDLTLTTAQNTTLEFSCPQPQDAFRVQIQKKIECTTSSCSPATGAVQPDLFKEFKRSLTWDISVPAKTVLTLDFAGDGLKETTEPDTCKDGRRYSLSTTTSDGAVRTKSYCRGGPVSHLDLLGPTAVSADVPKGGDVEETAFTAKAALRRGRMMSVTPDPDTSVRVSRKTTEPDCSVCLDPEPQQKCNPTEVTLRDARNTTVEFTCARPQDVFSVEINRDIDCTETACSGDIVQAESYLFPDFNRTFIWDLKVSSNRAFILDFPEPGMHQIPNGATCPDEHTYTVLVYLRTGPVTIGTYCKGGTISTIQVRRRGRMSLEVPGDRKLDPLDFKLSVGPETNMLAIMKVHLPRGLSDTDFTSATGLLTSDFPDDQQMRWDFVVPGMHNYTITFLNLTVPECLSKEVTVEYQKEGKKGTGVTLTDPQLKHKQGDFHLSLFNCETNTTLPGLNLNFRVSLMRSGHPVLCAVDLTQTPGVSLQIEKVGSDPYCEMSVDSVVKKKINVTAKAALSFLDCPNEDLRLTASKIIGCQSLNSCSVSGTLLTVPKLASCLPMMLHSFTWHLNVPDGGTVDLVSPSGTLRQSLPGQECNDSASLHVAEGDGTAIGDFCPNGIIQKVQVHSGDISVTVQDFTKTTGPFLNVSFSEEISESIIYRVSPQMSSPAVLATPNWPGGMKPFSTVSWIVTLPSWYQAAMRFVNISQPKCSQRHTGIKVQTLGSEEEILSRREDEEPEALVVPESFYLNMSNCLPEDGHFGVVTTVVLQKKTNLLAIILGIAGALLLLLIVLAVVCLVTKRRRRGKMSTESSIYVGKGNIFLPGERHFPKTRSDNESHVYDSIDEMMVYGHLLPNSSYSDNVQDHYKGMQVDSYHTFTGPTDGALPEIQEPDPAAEPEKDEYKAFLDPSETFIPSRPRTPIDRQDSLGFQDRRMVDNELYTFRSTGDMNTFRLSAADLEPQPAVDAPREESL